MKKTTSIITVVFAVAMLLTSCALHISKRETSKGKEVTKAYNVSTFKGIDAESAVEIIYTVSDSVSVKAAGYENDLSHLMIKVGSDSILHINRVDAADEDTDAANKIINLTPHSNMGDIKVYISGPAISSLTIEGASEFTAKGMMRTPSLDIEVSGASEIEMDSIETTTFKTETDGASKINIEQIKAQTVSIETSGAGKTNVGLVNVQKTLFSVDGAGKVDAHFDNCGSATIKVSGAGSLDLSGTLHHLDREIDGAASIDDDELKVSERVENKE